MDDSWMWLVFGPAALMLSFFLLAMFLSLAGWNRRAEPDQLPSAWDVQVRSRRAVGGVGRVVVRDGHVAFTPSGAQDVAWAVPVAGTKASRNYTPTRWPLLLRTPDDGRIFLRVAPVDHDLERSPWDRAPVQRHAKLFLAALARA